MLRYGPKRKNMKKKEIQFSREKFQKESDVIINNHIKKLEEVFDLSKLLNNIPYDR